MLIKYKYKYVILTSVMIQKLIWVADFQIHESAEEEKTEENSNKN